MKRGFFPLLAAMFCTALYFSTLAHAAVSITGNNLQGLCADYDSSTAPAICLGYVKGIANVLASGAAVDGYQACFNETASDDRLVDIVESYLQNAGNTGRQPAAVLVASALARSYPCAK